MATGYFAHLVTFRMKYSPVIRLLDIMLTFRVQLTYFPTDSVTALPSILDEYATRRNMGNRLGHFRFRNHYKEGRTCFI